MWPSFFAGGDRLLIGFGDVCLGVLLEVKLTALPRHSGEDGGARGGGAGVGIADDQGGETDAGLPEALQEGTPVDFGFGQGNGDAQNEAAAIDLADADGDEDGAAADGSRDPDFFIAGVGQNMAHRNRPPNGPEEGPDAPSRQYEP